MLFHSFPFLLGFLPAVLLGYFLLGRLRLTLAANAWLLSASVFFYGWWNIRYVPLILGSILFNYTIGGLLSGDRLPPGRPRRRAAIFWVGIAGNVLLLGYFKYMDFFIGSVNGFLGTSLPLPRVILPLGISFFTITQIAFLVDAYAEIASERSLLDYALFVTFFPHLLAGPILHHREMMPQFAKTRSKVVDYRNLARGIVLFAIGLLKKVEIADSLSRFVRAGFDLAPSLNLVEGWVTSLCYTFQLYFDFSGYSDMALGLGLMFNIRLPVNFDSPYRARSIIEFWSRWHITLSRFITDYLYTPILWSFRNPAYPAPLVAIFLAMLISGVWHGAGWTFVAWGALHGAALAVNHAWRRTKIRIPALLSWLLTFGFVNAAFVVFRAPSFASAAKVLGAMAGQGNPVPPAAFERFTAAALFSSKFGKTLLYDIQGRSETLWLMPGLVLLCLVPVNSTRVAERFRPSWEALLLVSIGFGYLFMNMGKVSEFLYFQF